MFVGSYSPIEVQIDPASGMTVDDLDFIVPDGLPGGLVSLARGPRVHGHRADTDPARGPRTWEACRPDHRTVERQPPRGARQFTLTTRWRGVRSGPGVWFSGTPRARLAGSAWGGGPAGPQNVATVPAIGTRRIAILFVDTSSQRYPTRRRDMQGHRDRWMDEFINGVAAGGRRAAAGLLPGGLVRQLRPQRRRRSGRCSCRGTFTSYFNADGTPKGSFFQAAITAGDALIDYNDFDTIVVRLAERPGDGHDADARSAWPYASIGHWGPYTTSEGNKNLGVISMPNDWGDLDDREIHETFCHELGHNLGLGDQYTPAVAGRNPGGWEIMDADDPLPHLSIAHRMMLGWVPAGWVRTFNFAAAARRWTRR